MRIAIVNKSGETVDLLRKVVASQRDYGVAWTAVDGAEAVEKALRDKPDLILMDLALPVMDGSRATRAIMEENPCAILLVTDRVSKSAARAFEAMGNGAVDAVDTPVLDADGNIQGAEELLKKIAMIERLIGKAKHPGKEGLKEKEDIPLSREPMIVIGSSTGGPKALTQVLSCLPGEVGAPMVIVQHVDAQFANGLAEWLAGQSKLKVVLATAGTRPKRDMVYVAGTNDHLVLGSDLTFHYVAEPKDNPYRPSVDAFFLSVLNNWSGRGVAVLLTGMGKDGAQGLLSLRRAGWHTIAQDQKTSVVYGMPKAAADLGAATEILPIEKIADAIMKHIKLTGRLA